MTVIEFKRGDTYALKFQRKDINDEVIRDKAEKVWFTVKQNYNTKKVAFQKTLEAGITFTNEDSYYHIIIESSDTRNLRFGNYVYDVQVMNGDVVKTIAIGKLKLLKEVTTDYE